MCRICLKIGRLLETRIKGETNGRATGRANGGMLFGFDECECSLLSEGVCPVETRSKEELKEGVDPHVLRYEHEVDYCAYLAWRMIAGDRAYLVHGPFDGRHRECAAYKLNRRGFDIKLETRE